MIAVRLARAVTAVALVFVATAAVSMVTAPTAAALAPVNPVRVDLAGHPANSGFLVFVEGDVALNADESEGTVAAGGNLSFNSTYNVAASTPKDATFTAPGDSGQTYLYVGGGMAWNGSQVLRVLNSGYSKIADASTYTARNKDQNGASVNYRIVKPGASDGSSPRIEGTTNQQTPTSIAGPVPSSLINVPAAFVRYRQLTTQLAACTANAALTNPNGGKTPIAQPYAGGARGRLMLATGRTNVLQMSTQDLANLSEITFVNPPSSSTPLIVNVTGTAFSGTTPNLAGISGSQAPYILWNFPQASSVVVTGGVSIEGTIYAPNAAVNWRPTQNVEGNLIAASFTHGPVAAGQRAVRELHDFPFATTVSCDSAAPTGTITLVKHVVNTGGGQAVASDWTLTATGPQAVAGAGNSPAVTNVAVNTGYYALAESGGRPNYAAGPWTCSGGAIVDDDVVHITTNANVSCEITNSYQPPPPATGTLTLVKHVDNVGGGQAVPAQWTLSATGPQTVTGSGNSVQVTDVQVATGNYVLGESSGPADYAAGSWACTGGALTDHTVTVSAEATVICELTNIYGPPPSPPAGSLTLVKRVDGGAAVPSDWTLTASGPQTVTGPGNSPQVTGNVVPVGNYVLSESGSPPNYLAGHWTCVGATIAGATITVAQRTGDVHGRQYVPGADIAHLGDAFVVEYGVAIASDRVTGRRHWWARCHRSEHGAAAGRRLRCHPGRLGVVPRGRPTSATASRASRARQLTSAGAANRKARLIRFG